jgi:hypothetical protein
MLFNNRRSGDIHHSHFAGITSRFEIDLKYFLEVISHFLKTLHFSSLCGIIKAPTLPGCPPQLGSVGFLVLVSYYLGQVPPN